MIRKEKRVIPATEREEIVERSCDLCGAKARNPGSDWDQGSYDVEEVTVSVEVRHRTGSSYPEGGSGREYSVDMCPKCFREKLIPWLESQGATIADREWSW